MKRKSVYKQLIIIAKITICLTVLLYFLLPISGRTGCCLVAEAYTAHTQEEAVAWAVQRDAENWGIDQDGNGLWCIDLIHAYRDYLGVPRCTGHAYTYKNDDHIPPEWSRESSPEPGDIVVIDAFGITNSKGYMTREYGHVGIVTEVNGTTFKYVSTAHDKEAFTEECKTSDVDCFIRPDFKCKVHTWDHGKITREAKCTKNELIDGEKVYTCTVCGETKTEVITAAHNYKKVGTKAATLEKNGNITHKCSKCGKKSIDVIYRPKTIKVKKSLVAYNGKAQKPGVIVKTAKGKNIPKKYYSVSYKNNRIIGTATATIRFKGLYSGSVTKTFKIGSKGSELVKCNGGKNKITVRWKKTTNVSGYQIQYSTGKNFKAKSTKTITVKGNKKVTYVIDKLKNGKKYYVRVRTYKAILLKNHYSPWSKVKSVKTKPVSAEIAAGNNMGKVVKYLRKGDLKNASLYNNKLPEIVNEKCINTMSSEMKKAYKKEIQNWSNKKYSDGRNCFYNYWLTDIDNDGKADLLLALWPTMAEAEIVAYKYSSGSLVKLGSVGGMSTCHAYPNHNGIVIQSGRQGHWWFDIVTYKDKELKKETLITINSDEIFLRNSLKSHSKWNNSKHKYVPIYDDLK